MKTYILLLAISLGACKSPIEHTKCSDYKNGSYQMTYNGMKTFIYRNGSYQHEVIPKLKRSSYFKVTWIDDCNYTIIPLDLKKYPGIRKDAMVTVSIDSVTNHSYFQTVTSNFNTTVIKGEVVRLQK